MTNGSEIVATATVAANGTSAFSTSLTIANLFTVINTNPSGPGSLAQAIINADNSPGNTISFAIPSGPLVISPTAALPLPTITAAVTIDGTSQAGIVIDGTGLSQDGLVLGAGSSGSTIKGLTVEGFGKSGIHIQSSNDTIADDVVGTSGLGNQTGILIDGGTNVTVGGTDASTANTIGFNTQQGVSILGGGNNTIEGNFIGTNSADANQGNAIGLVISGSSGNTIGGSTTGAANAIGWNAQQGVSIVSGIQNVVSRNLYVGTNGTGSPVQSSDISLGAGANNNQPAPSLAAASLGGGSLTVQLTVAVPTGTSVDVEIYQLVTTGSGQRSFLGSGSITTSTGLSSLTIPAGSLTNGSEIVATATVVANGTSAFSTSLTIANLFMVINTNPSGPGSLAQAIINADNSPGNTISFAIPSGPLVISPTAALPLPTITAAVTIDGTSQAGIVIDGTGLSQDGLVLGAGSSGSTIKGLTVEGFGKSGIHIQSSNDTIADDVVGASGLGNQTGILIDGGTNVTVGGTDASTANTIGFNTQQGVSILGGGNNTIEGNFIGTNSADANQGNAIGLVISGASGNTIGGAATGAANTIGFNVQQGVSVVSGIQNIISRNLYVGTNGTASSTNPPSGDISLGAGANNNQAAPTILTASVSNGSLTLTVSGLPVGATVEVYQVTSGGTPLRTFVGSAPVELVPPVTGVPTVMIPAGMLKNSDVLTATATVSANGTSAFSTVQVVANPYMVINTMPSGVGSLYQAIVNSNGSPGTPITFAIPGTAPHVIQTTPALPLPAITAPVVIDGTSESGVVVDGGNLTQDGFLLAAGSDGSTIKGLTIENFNGAAIHAESSDNIIQQDVLGATNGVMNLPNQVGVLIDGGSANTIGGVAANTIGFNSVAGVEITGALATGNLVEGNYIGTDSALKPAPNQIGVLIVDANENTVGGAGAGNTIGYNLQQGVSIVSGNQNVVSENLYVGANGTPSSTNPPSGDIVLGSGANNGLTAPTLVAASFLPVGSPPVQSLVVGVSGVVDGATIEVYQVNAAGQRIFVASGMVQSTTYSVPVVTIPVGSLVTGDQILATATVAADGTSSFSGTQTITLPLVVRVTSNDGPGSLRQAIDYANQHPGSTITFSIGSGFQSIQLSSPLPQITAQVTIDGTTEQDYTSGPTGLVGAPIIQVSAGGFLPYVFDLEPGSDHSIIQGLNIVGAYEAGILVASNFDTIDADWIGVDASNPLSPQYYGNTLGIEVDGATNTTIGLPRTLLFYTNPSITGYSTISGRNVISGNNSDAIQITGGSDNLVQDTYIGTDYFGSLITSQDVSFQLYNVGNGISILNSSGNTIGSLPTSDPLFTDFAGQLNGIALESQGFGYASTPMVYLVGGGGTGDSGNRHGQRQCNDRGRTFEARHGLHVSTDRPLFRRRQPLCRYGHRLDQWRAVDRPDARILGHGVRVDTDRLSRGRGGHWRHGIRYHQRRRGHRSDDHQSRFRLYLGANGALLRRRQPRCCHGRRLDLYSAPG